MAELGILHLSTSAYMNSEQLAPFIGRSNQLLSVLSHSPAGSCEHLAMVNRINRLSFDPSARSRGRFAWGTDFSNGYACIQGYESKQFYPTLRIREWVSPEGRERSSIQTAELVGRSLSSLIYHIPSGAYVRSLGAPRASFPEL